MMNWLKKLMPLISKLLKTDYNAKINEIKREIGRISGLVTTPALNAGKNEIPHVSYLVKQQIMLEK